MYDTLLAVRRACTDLSSSLRLPSARTRALRLIGDVFCDVELADDPMVLDETESRVLRPVAARDLELALAPSLRTLRVRSLTDAEQLGLDAAVAGPWRMLAAACWPTVSVQEQARRAAALHVASLLIDAAFQAGAFGEHRPSEVEFFARLEDLADEPVVAQLADQVASLLAEHGAGMRHLRAALSQQ